MTKVTLIYLLVLKEILLRNCFRVTSIKKNGDLIELTLHHIFLVEKTGLPVYSMCIDHPSEECALGMIDDSLAAGFIAAIKSFGDEVGFKNIQRIDSNNFRLLFDFSDDAILVFETSPKDSIRRYKKMMNKSTNFLNNAYYEGFTRLESQKIKFLGRFSSFLDNFKQIRDKGSDYTQSRAEFFKIFLAKIKEKLGL